MISTHSFNSLGGFVTVAVLVSFTWLIRSPSHQSMPLAGNDLDALYIHGIFLSCSQIELGTVYKQSLKGQPRVPPGPYRLELLGERGRVLLKRSFDLAATGSRSGKGFGFFVPEVKGLRGLRIIRGNQVLYQRFSDSDSIDPSALVPGSLIVERAASGEITARWKGRPNLGIVYRIRFSPNAGQTWEILALDWPRTSFGLPAKLLEAARKPMVEVQASDGLHTSTQVVLITIEP